MEAPRDTARVTSAPRRALRAIARPRVIVPVALAAGFVLFPFDWLANVWPAYGQIFDRVFVTARDHAIGHATLFFIAALLVLTAVPRLATRPPLYFALLILGSIGEESLQSLFKLQWPNLGDGRDLFFDFVGYTVAFALVAGARALRDWRARVRVVP